jgi:hypothetical protein
MLSLSELKESQFVKIITTTGYDFRVNGIWGYSVSKKITTTSKAFLNMCLEKALNYYYIYRFRASFFS